MALNDVLSAPKRFMTIIISFFLCTLFVLMLVNTVATMKSPNLITTFGTESNLYINDVDGVMKFMNTGDKESLSDGLNNLSDKISDDGMPCNVSVDIQYKYKVIAMGNEYAVSCAQSLNIPVGEYDYLEGSAPQNRNEIAVTPKISEMLGAKIGDTVTIDFGTENRLYSNCVFSDDEQSRRAYPSSRWCAHRYELCFKYQTVSGGLYRQPL